MINWLKMHLPWILFSIVVALTVSFAFALTFALHSPYTAVIHTFGNASTLTLDASKRSIITTGDFTCAEPSPDSIGTIATELAASLSGSASGDAASGAAKILSQTNLKELFDRTQGVQSIRDGMFRLCEARMNNGISGDFYEEQMIDLLTTLNFIVPLELCINATLQFERNEIQADALNAFMDNCSSLAFQFGSKVALNAAERLRSRRQATFQIIQYQQQRAAYLTENAVAALNEETVQDSSK